MKKVYLILTLFILFFIIAFAIPNINYGSLSRENKNDKSDSLNKRYMQDIHMSSEPAIKNVDKNVLILGIDSRKGEPSRSDVIILLNIKENNVNIISIPRDSKISLKNKDDVKINSSYVYGGIDLSKKTIENLLDVKIDNYIVLNFNAIKNGVNVIGGFSVTIPEDIKISDPELKKKFILKKGTHKLNGIQTLEYLRYRNDGKGDLARVYRQQQFIKDLQNNFLKLENIPLIPKTYLAIRNDIVTDMSASKIASYFMDGYRLKDNFNYYTLEGKAAMINKISYYIIDKNSIKKAKEILK